ncbi:MAG: phosphoglycerate kinase, partial [Nanoarchaeota archaeon]
MVFRTLKDINVAHKKVLVRVDFSVPIDDKGNITDDSRIRTAIPTIQYLRKQKAITILLTHFGRPEKVEDKWRTDILAQRLHELMKIPIYKIDDVIGSEVENKINELALGEVCLLENVRFYPEEEQNDPHFAMALSELAHIYVNDAFSVSHRNHASIVGVPEHLPSAAGFQLQKEIETMDKALHNPK